MEQLWYTWSSVGLGSGIGFRIRAASPGLSDIRSAYVQQFDKYLRYKLPPETDMYIATTENSPHSLAFIHVQNGPNRERFLLHKAYLGKDDYGRPGAFIVHLLTGLPETFLASDAIALMNARQWQQTRPDDTDPIELQPIARDDLALWKNGPAQLRSSDREVLAAHLPQVICAFLSLSPQKKLYLSTLSSKEADVLISGLIKSLPRILQSRLDLTFSTYESDVNECDARIVATCGPTMDQPRTLLQSSIGDRGIVINCHRWNTSVEIHTSHEILEYAQFATDCFVRGNESLLASILERAQKHNIPDINTFLFFSRIFINVEQDKITTEDIRDVLGSDELASICLKQSHFQNAVVNLMLSDLSWRNEILSTFDDMQRREVVGEARGFILPAKKDLARNINQRIRLILDKGQLAQCMEEIKTLLQITSTIQFPELFAELLGIFDAYYRKHQLLPFEVCSWKIHANLLKKWCELGSLQKYPAITSWLKIAKDNNLSWLTFEQLLREDLPEQWLHITVDDILSNTALDWEILYRLLQYGIAEQWLESDANHLIESQPIDIHSLQYPKSLMPVSWQKRLIAKYLQRQQSYWDSIVDLRVIHEIPEFVLQDFIKTPIVSEPVKWPVIEKLLSYAIPPEWLERPIKDLLTNEPPGWKTIFLFISYKTPVSWLKDTIFTLLDHEQEENYWQRIFTLLEHKVSFEDWLQPIVDEHLGSTTLEWETLLQLHRRGISSAWLVEAAESAQPVSWDILHVFSEYPNLPEQWSTIVLAKLICAKEELPPAEDGVIQLLAEKYTNLEDIMAECMASEETRNAALAFYQQLNQHKYAYQPNLFYKLMKKDYRLARREIDLLTMHSRIGESVQNLRSFVERAIDDLLVYCQAEGVIELLETYLTGFFQAEYEKERDRIIDKVIGQKNNLPPNLIQKANKCKILIHILYSTSKKPLLNTVDLPDLAGAILDFQLQNDEKFRARIFAYFVELIDDGAASIEEILKTQTQVFVPDHPEEMLYLLAKYKGEISNSSLSFDQMQPYINMVSVLLKKRVFSRWEELLQRIFEALLLPVDSQIRHSIDRKIRNSNSSGLIDVYEQWLVSHPLPSLPDFEPEQKKDDVKALTHTPEPVIRRATSATSPPPRQGANTAKINKVSATRKKSTEQVPQEMSIFNKYKNIYLNSRLQQLRRYFASPSNPSSNDYYYQAELDLLERVQRDNTCYDAKEVIEYFISKNQEILNQEKKSIEQDVQNFLNTNRVQGQKLGGKNEKALRDVIKLFAQCDFLFRYYRKYNVKLPPYIRDANAVIQDETDQKKSGFFPSFLTKLRKK